MIWAPSGLAELGEQAGNVGRRGVHQGQHLFLLRGGAVLVELGRALEAGAFGAQVVQQFGIVLTVRHFLSPSPSRPSRLRVA